ncbi:MAG TPA: hypothetical protein PLM98_08475 [Thiolinea sp.]|nr:hypothetical protein [Thiolinea sp.]
MKFFKRSLVASFIACICLSSTVVANTKSDTHLALAEVVDSNVVTKSLKLASASQDNRNQYAQDAAALLHQLEYKPSLERRQTNLSQLAEQRQVKDLEGAEQLEELLSSTQVIDAVQQTIEPFGLSTNNIADAYTLWWITAWQASEGETTKVDKQTAQAVKQQAVMIWLANPKLAQATDASKQEIAEALLIQALLTQAAMSRAGDQPATKQAVKEAVRQGAASSGLALEKMQLTAEGFVLK